MIHSLLKWQLYSVSAKILVSLTSPMNLLAYCGHQSEQQETSVSLRPSYFLLVIDNHVWEASIQVRPICYMRVERITVRVRFLN